MKLSTTSMIEGRFGYAKMHEIFAKAGFECVDHSMDRLKNDADVLNGEHYRTEAENMRRDAEKNGLTVNQIHAPFSWSDAQWADQSFYDTVIFPRVVRSLEIAGILGAKVAVVHPLHHFVYLGHEEEIYEKNMKYYRKLIPYAKEYGVKIGVENMYQGDPRRKHMIADTCAYIPEFIRYIDSLDSEQVTACLDIGHTTLVEQLDEPWDFIRALGHDRLGALHVHDTDYRNDLHVVPYQGIINWNEVTRALGEIDYQGDFTYEVGAAWARWMDDESVQIYVRYMSEIGHRLIEKIDVAKANAESCHGKL